MQPNVFLLLDAKLHFLYQIQKVHFLDIYQHRLIQWKKEFDKFLYLMLLYFQIYIYEQKVWTTFFTFL